MGLYPTIPELRVLLFQLPRSVFDGEAEEKIWGLTPKNRRISSYRNPVRLISIGHLLVSLSCQL